MNGMASALSGVLLLAQGRAEGLARVGPEPRDAQRSFWAVALCLPAFLFLRLLDWAWHGGVPAHAGHAVALELLAYVTGWAGFALASRPLVAGFGRLPRWPLWRPISVVPPTLCACICVKWAAWNCYRAKVKSRLQNVLRKASSRC